MTWKHGEPRHYFAVVKTCGRIARGEAAIFFLSLTPRGVTKMKPGPGKGDLVGLGLLREFHSLSDWATDNTGLDDCVLDPNVRMLDKTAGHWICEAPSKVENAMRVIRDCTGLIHVLLLKCFIAHFEKRIDASVVAHIQQFKYLS